MQSRTCRALEARHRTAARMSWTAIALLSLFTFDPISSSSSSFALLGQVRNGVSFS
jgi:hypothetical protein